MRLNLIQLPNQLRARESILRAISLFGTASLRLRSRSFSSKARADKADRQFVGDVCLGEICVELLDTSRRPERAATIALGMALLAFCLSFDGVPRGKGGASSWRISAKKLAQRNSKKLIKCPFVLLGCYIRPPEDGNYQIIVSNYQRNRAS